MGMGRFNLLIWPTLILSAGAGFACPSAQDLDEGIVITTGNPLLPQTEMVKHLGNGLYWHSQTSDMFPDTWNGFYHEGVLQLYTQRQSGSGKKIVQYDPPLVLGTGFSDLQVLPVKKVYGDPAGAKTWHADYTYTATPMDPITIDGCTYTAMKIAETGKLILPSGEVQKTDYRYVHLPELHFTYMLMGKGPDPVKISAAGFWDDVISDTDLRKMAAQEPALAKVLMTYGVLP